MIYLLYATILANMIWFGSCAGNFSWFMHVIAKSCPEDSISSIPSHHQALTFFLPPLRSTLWALGEKLDFYVPFETEHSVSFSGRFDKLCFSP